MDKRDDGGPAFAGDHLVENGIGEMVRQPYAGMTLRDYFAIHEPMPFDSEGSGLTLKLMQDLVPEEPMPTLVNGISLQYAQWEAKALARYRYMRADAMLRARAA